MVIGDAMKNYIIYLFAMKTMKNRESFDNRPTLSRSDARDVYDAFAEQGHKTAGKDSDSGYGGPAVTAMLKMANFESAKSVLDYGCGQGKLAELVLSSIVLKNNENKTNYDDTTNTHVVEFHWKGIDSSPKMVEGFQQRCIKKVGSERCSVEFLESGDPSKVPIQRSSIDRFVSTYCLDLLSEDDLYEVLNLAQRSLIPDNGLLLLAGITWGYRDFSIKTFLMTAIWEFLYCFKRRKVGGCRPQSLRPYLEAGGWRIEKLVRTMPNEFPWMVSEVIVARPPVTDIVENDEEKKFS